MVLKVGQLAEIKGYSNRFVIAGVDVAEGRVDVRSIDRCDPVSGAYGTYQLKARDAYLWMGVSITEVTGLDATAPGVVVRLIRTLDSHGHFKKAIVQGARFPEIAFHDPKWSDFLEALEAQGIIIPPDVPVEIGVGDAAHLAGVYTLDDIKRLEHVAA